MAGTTAATSAGDILALVRSGKAKTRRDVQELTGLSRSTLALRMSVLIGAGYIRETGQASGATGRPARLLSFDDARQLVLCVDLGATHASLAIIDAGGNVIIRSQSEVRIQDPPESTLRTVARRLGELLSRAGRSMNEVVGVGLGIPAPVRYTTQRPNNPPLMPGWHDFPISDVLASQLGVAAFVDNDANLMGLGEAQARYPDAPSLLFVKVGTGIGAGVILHGQPERGIAGGAGDIGHIQVDGTEQARRCTCGAYGCLATRASGGAIARSLREEGHPEVQGAADVGTLLEAGDAETIRLTERAGALLGDVLATSVALLNPAVVVLGGSIARHGSVMLDAVRERIYERTVPMATRELFIAPSSLGDDAALQGARHMVIDRMFSADAVDARLESV